MDNVGAMSNGSAKAGLQNWQRANIVAAINYLGELIGRSQTDPRAKAVYDGLLDVLDPSRRAVRSQRELTSGARAAAFSAAERRRGERRRGGDRRSANLGPPGGIERRAGRDRRSGQERRKR